MRSLAAVAMMVLVGACGSGSDSTSAGPEEAVEQLLTALEAGSCKDVKAVVVTPAAVDCEMVASLEGSFADDGVDLADITYSVEDLVGDSGSVTTDFGHDEPDGSWDVERFDGTWKVVFDSEE